MKTLHLIIGAVIIALVLGAYFAPMAIFVSPAKYYASPGEEVVYDLVYLNQRDFTCDYYSKAWIGDDLIGVSTTAYGLQPAETEYGTLTFDAPTTPGTYTVEIYSYYTESWGEGGWDEQVDVILVVSSATPTATPTEYPTETPTPDPCDGVVCDPYCEGTVYHYNGYCDNGQCVYQEEYNSAECITETPTETLTPTPTETDTPNGNGEDDLSGIWWWGGGIISVLLVLLLALRAKQ